MAVRYRPYKGAQKRRHPTLPPGRTLFLHNFPFTTPIEVMRDALAEYGELRIFDERISNRGLAFACFHDLREAERAQAGLTDKIIFGSRPVRVHFAVTKGEPSDDSAETIVVKAVGTEDMTVEKLRPLCESLGDVRSVTKEADDTFLVEYFDSRETAKAMPELNGFEVAGGKLEVKPALISQTATFKAHAAATAAAQEGHDSRGDRDEGYARERSMRPRSPPPRYRRSPVRRRSPPRRSPPRRSPSRRSPPRRSPPRYPPPRRWSRDRSRSPRRSPGRRRSPPRWRSPERRRSPDRRRSPMGRRSPARSPRRYDGFQGDRGYRDGRPGGSYGGDRYGGREGQSHAVKDKIGDLASMVVNPQPPATAAPYHAAATLANLPPSELAGLVTLLSQQVQQQQQQQPVQQQRAPPPVAPPVFPVQARSAVPFPPPARSAPFAPPRGPPPGLPAFPSHPPSQVSATDEMRALQQRLTMLQQQQQTPQAAPPSGSSLQANASALLAMMANQRGSGTTQPPTFPGQQNNWQQR